jgi:hypothetical protein
MTHWEVRLKVRDFQSALQLMFFVTIKCMYVLLLLVYSNFCLFVPGKEN